MPASILSISGCDWVQLTQFPKTLNRDLLIFFSAIGDWWQVSGRSSGWSDQVTSEWLMTSEWQMLAVKMIRQQISLSNRHTNQSTILTNRQRQWRIRAKHYRLKSEPPLLKGLDIHKNSPVFVTNWHLASWVGFISSHLTANKPSQLTRERSRVHRRWASCLRPKACLHWSSNQGFIIVTFVGT